MNFTVRQCAIEDLHTLREISYHTFREAFAEMNTPESMKAYLEVAFNTEKLRAELANSSSLFYFVYCNEVLAGYLKLNEEMAQTDICDPLSIEIERIYIVKEFRGKGLGGFLLNKSAEIASSRKKTYLWLGVWENNENALRFYKRNGFYEMGKHSFFMGEEEQTDFILRKDITANSFI